MLQSAPGKLAGQTAQALPQINHEEKKQMAGEADIERLNRYQFCFGLTGLQHLSFPRAGIEPGPSAMKVQTPNPWTTREFLIKNFFSNGQDKI